MVAAALVGAWAARGAWFQKIRRYAVICAVAVATPAVTIAAVMPGAIPARFAVGDQGEGTYLIPIDGPAATGGFKPNLALTYDHLAGNGFAGMHWTVTGISAITRCQTSYAQDGTVTALSYTSTDRFCLDGQRLVDFSGTYGASGTQYRTEIETFQRVYQAGVNVGGGPAQFYVQHGNGLTSYYGYTNDSQIERVGSSAIRIWYISYTEDQFGNRITYTYDENAVTGEVFPVQITWTSNPGRGLSAKYKVAITSETRPADDQRTGYDPGGAKWAMTKRIDKIDVIHNNAETIRTYDLTYTTPPATATGRTQLSTVTLCRAADCLPATAFTVQNGTRGWNGLTDTTRPSSGFAAVGDVDGDGKKDIIDVSASSTWRVYRGNSNGSLDAPLDSGVAVGPAPGATRVIDFDSDGRSDLLYKGSAGVWRVLRYDGTSFTDLSTSVPTSNPSHANIRDFDGDGLRDWVYRDGANIVWRRNQGTVFLPPQTLGWFDGLDLIHENPDRGPDFNGDGRDDLVSTGLYCEIWDDPPREMCTPKYTILIATGTTYAVAAEYVGVLLGDQVGRVVPMDINGDGLDDIAYEYGWIWHVQLSTGNGFAPAVSTGIQGNFAHFVTDYDNDGREDLVLGVGDYWRIYRSNGATLPSAYTDSLYSPGAGAPTGDYYFAADISGDGFEDVVRAYGGTWHVHKHQTALPDVVTTFTDGLGYAAGFQYESLSNTANYAIDPLQYPPPPYARYLTRTHYVVTAETHDNGIGGTRVLTHHYTSAYMDVSGRRWHSFSSHRVDDDVQGTYALTYFAQAFPLARMVSRQELWSSDDQLIRRVNLFPEAIVLSNRYLRRLQSTMTREYEAGGVANGQHLRTIDVAFGYNDTYGHVTTRTTTLTDPVTAESWTSTTTFNPTADDDDWCLGLPGLVQTTNTAPGQPQAVRTRRHTFDPDTCRLAETRDESDSSPAKQLKTTFAYDGYGNVDLVSLDSVDGSAQDRSTDFGHDADGQYATTVTIGGVNLTTAIGWNYLLGQRESVTGPDQLTTSWQYDAFGRVIQETTPDGTSGVSYTACGGTCWPQNSVFFARAQGSDGSDDYAYFDELGRSVGRAWMLPSGTQGREETRYNTTGRVDRVSRPYLSTDPVYWVTYVYDLLGRQLQENAPINESISSGSLTTTEFRGHEVWVTDAESRTTKYTHNAARQIKQVLDALNGATTYSYAPFGELATVTDQHGNTTTVGYDPRGLKTSLDDPDLGLWGYGHNVYGELVSETDPKTNPNPTRTYVYDPAGRIASRSEPEGTTSWTYYNAGIGAIGKSDTVSGPGNSEHYEYSSSFGAPTLVRRVIDGATYDTNYAYHTTGGSQGKLSRITYPTSSLGTRLKADYSYDGFGYLHQVKNGDVPSVVWYTLSSADALGRERTAIFGNGVNEVRGYDRANGTLQSIASGPTGAPTSVQNLTYQWDRVGNLTQRRDFIPGKTEDFIYDALSRLRTVQLNAGTVLSVDYDAIGNISYKSDVGTYAYGAGSAGPHAVTSVSGIQSNTYQYDANGNMNNKDGDTITWYSFNKPLQVNYGAASSQMVYGVHRQRIKQSAVGYSAGALHYVGPEFELLTQGPLRADLHYIFANGRAVTRYTTYNFQGPDTRYLHRDNLRSVVATSSDTGSVLSRYEFDAFGSRWQTAGSGLFTQKGFTGHEHLDAVDLIDMGGRMQDPVLGRFISADPFVQAPYHSQSLNRYSYVWNNPVTLVDPSGFQADCNGENCPPLPVPANDLSHLLPEWCLGGTNVNCDLRYANYDAETTQLVLCAIGHGPCGDERGTLEGRDWFVVDKPRDLIGQNTCPALTYPDSCEFVPHYELVTAKRTNVQVHDVAWENKDISNIDIGIGGWSGDLPDPSRDPKRLRPPLPEREIVVTVETVKRQGGNVYQVYTLSREGYCRCTDRSGVTGLTVGKEFFSPVAIPTGETWEDP